MRSIISVTLLILLSPVLATPVHALDSVADADTRLDASGYSDAGSSDQSAACEQATKRAHEFLRKALRLALDKRLLSANDVSRPQPITTSRSWDSAEQVCTVTYHVVVPRSAMMVRSLSGDQGF